MGRVTVSYRDCPARFIRDLKWLMVSHKDFPLDLLFIFFESPSVKSIKPLGVLSKALLETDWSTSSAGVNMCSYIIFLYFHGPASGAPMSICSAA
jgi:hypothetical protein